MSAEFTCPPATRLAELAADYAADQLDAAGLAELSALLAQDPQAHRVLAQAWAAEGALRARLGSPVATATAGQHYWQLASTGLLAAAAVTIAVVLAQGQAPLDFSDQPTEIAATDNAIERRVHLVVSGADRAVAVRSESTDDGLSLRLRRVTLIRTESPELSEELP